MTPLRIAVVDLETTGLFPAKHDRVVEIAIVVISADGEIHSEYETLVNPARDMGPSRIHRISAGDVLRAPRFANIAGDVLELIANADVIAGHNVSFDHRFLIKEFELIDAPLPDVSLLCTCTIFGRSSLEACCSELGIQFQGQPHRAIVDARATTELIWRVLADDPALLNRHKKSNASWPVVQPLQTPCFRREHAEQANSEPPRFLQRLAQRLHHDVETTNPELLAYLVLIDRILEDRLIDEAEEESLVDAANSWKLTREQVDAAHKQYIQNLAISALADGVISESERRDLHLVARLLGQDRQSLDIALETAENQLRLTAKKPVATAPQDNLTGMRVCFTGELSSTINREPISRALAEKLANDAGLVVASGVTKKLDILVVADPNTQSGKAKKAREYGTRILADAVFWQMIGVDVD